MIKLNDTNSTNINVLGEDELKEVVGGCHRRQRNYGHCGGYWRKRNYGHCGGYGGGYDSYEGSEGYEGSDSYDDSESDDGFSGNNVQVANVDVTINIAQVQG